MVADNGWALPETRAWKKGLKHVLRACRKTRQLSLTRAPDTAARAAVTNARARRKDYARTFIYLFFFFSFPTISHTPLSQPPDALTCVKIISVNRDTFFYLFFFFLPVFHTYVYEHDRRPSARDNSAAVLPRRTTSSYLRFRGAADTPGHA